MTKRAEPGLPEFPPPTGVPVLTPRPAPLPTKDTTNMHLARIKRAWVVRYPSYHPLAGKYESFADSVYGSEEAAKTVARHRRDQAFAEAGLPVHLRIRGPKSTGRVPLAGVSLSANRGDRTKWSTWRWVAHWVMSDRQVHRSFGIHLHGFDGALFQAVALREAMTGVLLDPDAVEEVRAMQYGPPPSRASRASRASRG